jgi:hypothetical protein
MIARFLAVIFCATIAPLEAAERHTTVSIAGDEFGI